MLKKLTFKTFTDERGALTAVELKDYIQWEPRRIYYLTDITAPRGHHCVKNEKKFYVCMKGSLKCKFHDGTKWEEFELNGPSEAVLMEGDYFRDFYDFSADCVLMAVSSVNYNPEDYIYDLEEFINYRKG